MATSRCSSRQCSWWFRSCLPLAWPDRNFRQRSRLPKKDRQCKHMSSKSRSHSTCTYICAYICTYICAAISAPISVPISVSISVLISVLISVPISVSISVPISVSISVLISVPISVQLYLYLYLCCAVISNQIALCSYLCAALCATLSLCSYLCPAIPVQSIPCLSIHASDFTPHPAPLTVLVLCSPLICCCYTDKSIARDRSNESRQWLRVSMHQHPQ